MDLKGKMWKELDEKTKEDLMKRVRMVDARTAGYAHTGDCILDFEGTPYSIPGHIDLTGEEAIIQILDDSILYSSEEGMIK